MSHTNSRYSFTMEIQKLQRLVIDALEDVKAQDIKVFNTSHITGMFDRVIIVSGSSNRQTRSIASHVITKVKETGIPIIAFEGHETGEWVLIDIGDVVIHIMQPSIRQYYNLEEIWGEKPVRVKLLPQSTMPALGELPDFSDNRYNDLT